MEEPNAGTTGTTDDEIATRAVTALERIAKALEDSHVVMSKIAGIPHETTRHEHWDEGQSPEDRAAGIAAAQALSQG